MWQMLPRPARIALLIFQALWLNVIVPGHTRGIVTLPGAPCSDGACSANAGATDACCLPSGPSKQPAHNQRASYCAICAFSARLSPPPVIDLTLPPLSFLRTAPIPAPELQPGVPSLPTYDGRAPPMA